MEDPLVALLAMFCLLGSALAFSIALVHLVQAMVNEKPPKPPADPPSV